MKIGPETKWWQDPSMVLSILIPLGASAYAIIRFGPW